MDAVVVIDKFRKHLASRGYAETTCESYAKNLEQFKRHLLACGVTDLRKVTHQVILDYQQKVSAEPIALETRALLCVIYGIDNPHGPDAKSEAACQLPGQALDVVVGEGLFGEFRESKVQTSGRDGICFLIEPGSLPGQFDFIHPA